MEQESGVINNSNSWTWTGTLCIIITLLTAGYLSKHLEIISYEKLAVKELSGKS